MGKVTLEISASAEFFVNLCLVKKIPLKKVVKTENSCVVTVERRDLNALKDVLTEKNRTFRIIKDNSFVGFATKNVGRIGIYLGLALIILMLIFYSATVTRLTVIGAENVEREVIEEKVRSLVNFPAKKSEIERKKLAAEILKTEGVSSASAEIRGNTLIVEIIEELPKTDMENLTDFNDITSKYDAVITRIITYSGEAKVKKGDVVKNGDVLISAEKTVDEATGLTTREHPNGEIYGRVWLSKSIVIPQKVILTRRTGRTETRTSFFRPKGEYDGQFSQYEKETIFTRLYGIFPIGIYVEKYYETENYEEDFDPERNAERIVRFQVEKMESELPEGTEPGRFWFFVKTVDKTTVFDIYYEAEVKIS